MQINYRPEIHKIIYNLFFATDRRHLGGIPALTAAFVITTGIIGTRLSPIVFRWMKQVSPITKGLMLGVAAHGAGTAKAQEYGKMETAIASLAMIFMGIITTLLAPEVVPLCFQFLGIN
ncbi:LrgB family protein [Pelosinus sp. UFO1]|uniref:LrgB family protein n=1 Tax=Pelosinus sp. UFO1 TaxID=484770 RepID=UPI001F279623|nr:LrgB family protein [Pelosinus sp. UFO1]